MTTYEHVARHLDALLGEDYDDVAFAEIVDAVTEDLVARFARVGATAH